MMAIAINTDLRPKRTKINNLQLCISLVFVHEERLAASGRFAEGTGNQGVFGSEWWPWQLVGKNHENKDPRK